MKTDIDKQFQGLPLRGNYEEGRELMTRATEKIASKYRLSVLCMTSRDDQPDHAMHIQNMSVETMASFMVSLLTEAKNKQFTRAAIGKVPEYVWIKALGIRYAAFYMTMGAAAWAGFEILLKHIN